MNNVLLISLGASRKEYPHQQHTTYITSPGMHYVKAMLQEQGYNVEMINQPNENLLQSEVIEKILEQDPDVALFNQFFSTRTQVRATINSLKVRCLVGIGGHDITFQVDYLPQYELSNWYRNVSFLWRGEAELGLADYIANSKREGGLSIIDNRPNRVQDLDSLPILSHDDYSGEIGFIVTARGCYCNGCDFCSTSRFYPDGWRGRSCDHVERELMNLKKNNKRYIAIFDDNFFGFSDENFERGAAIIDKCKELDLKILFLMASVKQVVELQDKGYLERFQGTLNNVLLGVENIDENALRILGKRCNPDNHRKFTTIAIDALRNNGISSFLGYINFNPFSSMEELESNACYLHAIHEQTAQFQFLSKKLQLFEGTRFFDTYYKDIDVSGRGIMDAEYIYQFKDNRVGYVASIAMLVQNVAMVSDCIDFEISTILYMNQLQNSGLGKEYDSTRKEISNNNFEFFIKLLELCKRDESDAAAMIDLLNRYKEKSKSKIKEARSLYFKILGQSKYSLQEATEYIDRIYLYM